MTKELKAEDVEIENLDSEDIKANTIEEENQSEVSITGGIVLLRTDDGRIVYEKIDEVSWEDITMFSEYLNRLKDIVWDEHIRVDENED